MTDVHYQFTALYDFFFFPKREFACPSSDLLAYQLEQVALS